MSNSFKNRVFGCAIIKSVNSNYNADFSHKPRTLPNSVVYATDKALKYSVRNYWKNALQEKVFYTKSLSGDLSPRDLGETYEEHFGKTTESDAKKMRLLVLQNLLTMIDVRLFGGTFAEKKANISIHGTAQITHGVNRFGENVIYSEQIMSPFRNSSEKGDNSAMTTLGTQSKLQEGHYVHHFSVNPQNIADYAERVNSEGLTQEDIDKLKEGLRKGVSYYDSSAKAGSENEVLLWVQLKEGSKIVLPSFVELVIVNEKREIDLGKIKDLLAKAHIKSDIEAIELYYHQGITTVVNAPEGAKEFEL
jgi:CRISPR-associated protein Csh2